MYSIQVFQEWFDVDFNTDGNETVVLNKYCFKTLPNKFEDELDQNVTNNVFSKRVSLLFKFKLIKSKKCCYFILIIYKNRHILSPSNGY